MADAEAPDGARNSFFAGVVPVLFSAALFASFATLLPPVAAGEVVRYSAPWIPSLGIELAFLVDGLGLTFALLISGIGTFVLLYANTYLAGHPLYGRFSLFLTAFMVSMLGLVLADDLILLFVFWELTTITSYLLIGFSHAAAISRRNALQALFVTGAGALAFLAGLILLGFAGGTTSISGIIAQGDALREHVLYTAILILLLCGAFTKSAQVPFHFWLPNAMAAPTPVSAFLHSATMVKAGVYFLARMHPAMADTPLWLWILTLFGAATAVFASLQALRQRDLKQALAYTTLMALGTLVLFLGQTSGYAMTAFATFLVVHSLYKAALFLVVGCIDQATGTRDVNKLGGLGLLMPITAFSAALAAMSMAGFPPFLGFIAKELLYAGSIEVASSTILVSGATLLASALMLAVAGVVAVRPFWVSQGAFTREPKEARWPMLAGPLVMAVLGLALGLFPGPVQEALIHPTVTSLMGAESADPKQLKLWAGVNVPLFLSLATFALGFAIYAVQAQARAALERGLGALPDMDAGYDRFMEHLKAFAGWQTHLIQRGQLTFYLAVTFATIAVGLIATMVVSGLQLPAMTFKDLGWINAAIAALLVAGSGLALITQSRIAGIAALGVVGIATALIFIVFSAPDVAITQLLVETLVVVLVAVVMLRLPDLTPKVFRPAHAIIALGVGASVTLILLSVLATPLDRRLSDYFEIASWPDAYGRNIVNVILVDFRALDTFGEIAVVVIASLAAYALLRTTQNPKSKVDQEPGA